MRPVALSLCCAGISRYIYLRVLVLQFTKVCSFIIITFYLKSLLIHLHSQGMSVIIHLHSQGMSVMFHLHSQGMSVIFHLHSQGECNSSFFYTHKVSVISHFFTLTR